VGGEMKLKTEKCKQLGMPFGTACNRLRKMVMHDLLRNFGLDRCFKCGLTIESPEDLSLDHKQNWQHVDVALFWDLSNIAFSHRICNKTDKRRPARGIRSGRSKLKESDIISIRLDSRDGREIAKEYGISESNVGYIKRRDTWRHL
jgi:hypothetical protein